jgi:hypothetical protein
MYSQQPSLQGEVQRTKAQNVQWYVYGGYRDMHRSGYIALCRSDIKRHLLLLDNEGCLMLTNKSKKMYTGRRGLSKVHSIGVKNVELQLKKEETVTNPALYSCSSADPDAS